MPCPPTESYEHIDPAVVGNERRILVSELSGRSNIVALTGAYDIQDDRDLLDRILAQVVSLENVGYQFEAADASFDLLVRRTAGAFHPHFESSAITWGSGPDERGVKTEATVKLRAAEQIRHEVAAATAR